MTTKKAMETDELTGLPTHVFVCLSGPENNVCGVLMEEESAEAWVGLDSQKDALGFRHYKRVRLGVVITRGNLT